MCRTGLLSAFLLATPLGAGVPIRAATELHVSPGGSDDAPGTAERPLATLARARDAIRALRDGPGLPAGGITVWIEPGRHHPEEPLVLESRDSGTASAPIVWRGRDPVATRVVGGRDVEGFVPVTDPGERRRLAAVARDHVVVADVRSSGVRDLGTVAGAGTRLEVFFRDRPLTLARWPDEGFVTVAGLAGGEPMRVHGRDGNREGRLLYSGDRPSRWSDEPDVWLHGYWFWDWSDGYQKVASIDPEERRVDLSPPWHNYGYRKGARFYALNVLAELDRPGEWYLDRDRGRLYLWPPASDLPCRVVVSVLPSLFELRGSTHVVIRDLTLEATRSTAVRVTGGASCLVAGCAIRNTGGDGVRIEGGREHAVRGCDIYRVGERGVSVTGGDRRTLTPGGHVVENCHIHHFGRIYRTYRPAVGVGGVGQRVARCRIHDGPHNAIQLGGNDHTIELNEIYRVCHETGDVGAFYMGRDWTARGTVIRGNFFHDIEGPGLHGAMAVYLDDAASGIRIESNAFWRAGRAAFIGGGRDNVVENNVFVECPAAVHVDARGIGWMRYHVEPGGTLPQRLAAMPYREPPWRDRYPELVGILDDEPGAPKGNVVRRNISWKSRWLDVEEKAKPWIRFEQNLVDVDPQFVDAASGDFRLRPDSPAFALGFRELPWEEIGPRKDAHRSRLPAPSRPAPPGDHVRPVRPEDLRETAFSTGQPVVGTYYFYWYDDRTRAHFVDGDGTDALTRHPDRPEGYSYRSPEWHRRELEDVLDAGLDFILPVYWGYPGAYDNWSFVGLPPLVEAARELQRAGKSPPRIGCFYDTSTLRFNGPGFHADLTRQDGREWLYVTARDFFSLIPPDLWATVDGRPILWLYSAGFAARQDPSALDYLRDEFRRDFGVEPWIVKEVSWKGRADATYAWGAALRPSVYGVAAVGPGYDHSAVPGRTPLVREREDGAFYRSSWEWILSRPLRVRPAIAVVETWNEWHEGTDIAPSLESGRQYVDITREYADRWRAREVLRPAGPWSGRSEVSVELGAENRERGIRQAEAADGKTEPVRVEGRGGRRTVRTEHGGRFVYLDVADSFYWADGTSLEVVVSYLDRGAGTLRLDYDSLDVTAPHDGAFHPTAAVERRGEGGWKTTVWRLENAAFTGRSNGYDLRIADVGGDLIVGRVVVRKVEAPDGDPAED